jgi:hypothetical protein
MTTRSHSELMTRPATLEMDERLAARNSSNELFTRRNGLSNFRGLRTVDPLMSAWMTSLTTATMVTTANSRPRMSLATVDHINGRRKEGRMNEPAPCSKTFGTQEKEVKDHSRRNYETAEVAIDWSPLEGGERASHGKWTDVPRMIRSSTLFARLCCSAPEKLMKKRKEDGLLSER